MSDPLVSRPPSVEEQLIKLLDTLTPVFRGTAYRRADVNCLLTDLLTQQARSLPLITMPRSVLASLAGDDPDKQQLLAAWDEENERRHEAEAALQIAHAERDEARKDAAYHSDCRPNRRQAEAWRDDAKAVNDRWADEVAKVRALEAQLALAVSRETQIRQMVTQWRALGSAWLEEARHAVHYDRAQWLQVHGERIIECAAELAARLDPPQETT